MKMRKDAVQDALLYALKHISQFDNRSRLSNSSIPAWTRSEPPSEQNCMKTPGSLSADSNRTTPCWPRVVAQIAWIEKQREPVMIKKVKEGYQVLSSKGKNLGGPYKTLEEAKKRLRQVEFFKHRKA
jgi:hypothetical protein